MSEKIVPQPDDEILVLFRSLICENVALPVAAMNALVAKIKVF